MVYNNSIWWWELSGLIKWWFGTECFLSQARIVIIIGVPSWFVCFVFVCCFKLFHHLSPSLLLLLRSLLLWLSLFVCFVVVVEEEDGLFAVFTTTS